MELNEFIDKDRVCILQGNKKKEVLLELIELISQQGEVHDIERLKDAIFYREKLMSTGIGLGIAVPHVRIEGVYHPIVAMGISHEGILDYESIDNQPVKIVVMIVAGKWQHKEYIKLLSLIVTKMKDDSLRGKLIRSRSPEEIYKILLNENNGQAIS